MSANDDNRGTTAALNAATGPTEVSSVVPDTSAGKTPDTTLAQTGDASTIAASSAVAGTATPTAASIASTPNTATFTQQPETNTSTETQTQSETKATATKTPMQILWEAVNAHTHKEIWGVTLADPSTHVPTQIILQKYLNANDGNTELAKDQLLATLNWRAEHNPLSLIEQKHSATKFKGLGYITTHPVSPSTSTSTPAAADTSSSSSAKAIITWNIYGTVKDLPSTFGDLPTFLAWRVALMELAIHELSLSTATQSISPTYTSTSTPSPTPTSTASSGDPYKIIQIHDYKSISFLRSPPSARTAARKTVEVLAMAYPETLREKFFVNVPAIMGFMYGVMKLFVAPKTLSKFHPMSDGRGLAKEIGVEGLPREYGGTGQGLEGIGTETLLG